MKTCTHCKKSYGSGDQVNGKFCSDSCQRNFQLKKLWLSRPDIFEVSMMLKNRIVADRMNAEQTKAFLNWIKAELS